MFVLVSYDISDDKRRYRVARTMEDFGTRVQYSVFECRLGTARLSTPVDNKTAQNAGMAGLSGYRPEEVWCLRNQRSSEAL